MCTLQYMSLLKATECVLRLKGWNDVLCVAQIYDGASVLKIEFSGVQACFREEHPEVVLFIVMPMN